MPMFNGDSPVVISRESFQELLNSNYTTCERYGEDPIRWKGFPSGQYPTEHVLSFFMLQFIFSFLISRSLYFVLRPLRQPKFVCDILTGIIMGPSLLGRGKTSIMFQPKNLLLNNTVSSIAGIYFVFLNSVKMDKSRILLSMKKVWNVSLVCLVVPLIITIFLLFNQQKNLSGLIVGEGYFLVFMSLSLSLSNYPVVTHALSELNLLTSELGQLAMSAVVLHEIIGSSCITMLAIIPPRRGGLSGLLCTGGVIAFIVFTIRPLVKWIIRATPEGKPVKRVYIKLILMAPLITAMLTDTAGSTTFVGAQIMGLIIPAGPPLGSAVAEKIELMFSEFLLPFFYIQIGQLTDVYSIQDRKAFFILMLIWFSGYLARIAGSLLTLLCCNTDVRNTIVLGFILSIQGVTDFVVILWWRVRQFVNDPGYTALVLSSVAMTAIVTPLIQILAKPGRSLKRSSSLENCMRTLQSTPFNSQLRVLCCIHCEDNVKGMINLLKASNPTESSTVHAYALHLTQLTGRTEPLFAPYENQKRSKTNSTDRIMSALSKNLMSSSVTITIEPWMMIAPYKTMHETICKLARDELVTLIIVPFPESLELSRENADLRSLNMKIINYAPSIVGILVDRSAHCSLSTTNFSYNVAVFFIGGPDDREALAMASRMSGHPGVSITMIRIELRADKEEYNENERYLDELSINDFKTRNIGNARVVCKEVMVEETMQGMDAIRSVDNRYDLVIVGKEQGNFQFEKEMLPWVEYKELGVIGDIVASSDFCGGTMSVLVMHCASQRSNNGISGAVTDNSWNISDERSGFSFSSSNRDTDNEVQAFVANQGKSVKLCTKI